MQMDGMAQSHEPRPKTHAPHPTPRPPPRARWTGWRRATSHVPSMRRLQRRRRKTERREEEHEASASAGSSSRSTRGAARPLHPLLSDAPKQKRYQTPPQSPPNSPHPTPSHPCQPYNPGLTARTRGPGSRPGAYGLRKMARRRRAHGPGLTGPGSRPGLTAGAHGAQPSP